MSTNQFIKFKKHTKYILISLITLNLLNCSPEDISELKEGITDETATEGEIETDNPDTVIDIPTTNPVTEEPIENPTTNPVTEEPTEEAIDVNLTEAEALLILVNESRSAEGLTSLVLNSALTKAALAHSVDMETNDYFDHTGLNGSRFWERATDAGYTGSAAGENIASGQRNAEAVHTSWMNSDGHRANILNSRITEMGLGNSGRYWTQIFGVGQ